KFILKTVSFFAEQPFVQVYLPHPSAWIIILVILAVLLIFNLQKRINKIYLAVVLITLTLYVNGWLLRTDQKLSVIFADVGQGDAAIIRIPGGETIVVDSGDNVRGRDKGKDVVLPLLRYYGIDRIKYLIGTHPHSDHIGGFRSLIKEVLIDTLVLSGYQDDSKFYNSMIRAAGNMSIPIRYVQRGQVLYVNPICRIYVLHPDKQYLDGVDQNNAKVNNSSIVLKIVYGATSFLLVGDLEKDGETYLANYSEFLDADVLKIGHHGSKTSTYDEFLDLVTPGFGVISVGRRNRFYHPNRSTVTRLIDHGVTPLRTDHLGAIVFESDGREVKVINWRQ
ncbi:MAG: ComEC/Rec2 family competence protein, partial [Calditrichaceae bacterium]